LAAAVEENQLQYASKTFIGGKTSRNKSFPVTPDYGEEGLTIIFVGIMYPNISVDFYPAAEFPRSGSFIVITRTPKNLKAFRSSRFGKKTIDKIR
jgi:hypothetical protein